MGFDTIELNTVPTGEREKVLTDIFDQPDVPPLDLGHVTDQDLKDALRAVAMENPGHVYTAPDHLDASGMGRCFYVHWPEGDEEALSPGCMVGHALYRVGVPLDRLQDHETRPAAHVLEDFFPQASGDTLSAYNSAQARQDIGHPWGKAIRDAGL